MKFSLSTILVTCRGVESTFVRTNELPRSSKWSYWYTVNESTGMRSCLVGGDGGYEEMDVVLCLDQDHSTASGVGKFRTHSPESLERA